MENKTYLDFDEAVSFLNTTPSTLYKWLQNGKIPGHKLGRQWRFIQDELELHVSGKTASMDRQKEVLALAQLLVKRSVLTGGVRLSPSLPQISEQILWDAYQSGRRLIHIEPSQGRFQIRYRHRQGFEMLTTISEETFRSLDHAWRKESTPTKDQDTRRMYLHRNDNEALQVRYQKLETITGPRVTLQLWQPFQDVPSLKKITDGNNEALKIFEKWSKKSHGLIVICGSAGSGKTTTGYSLLYEIKKSEAVIFTMENPVYLVGEGLNQAEIHHAYDFESTFEKIYNSDPDVLYFDLAEMKEIEAMIHKKSISAAQSGHLVILQMAAASCDEAYETLGGSGLEKTLIGICHQKLIPSEKRLIPQYSFWRTL
jgi:MSHA biogenesis protein MshE